MAIVQQPTQVINVAGQAFSVHQKKKSHLDHIEPSETNAERNASVASWLRDPTLSQSNSKYV